MSTLIQFRSKPDWLNGRCRSFFRNLCEFKYSRVVSPRAMRKRWYPNRLPGYGRARTEYRNIANATRSCIRPDKLELKEMPLRLPY